MSRKHHICPLSGFLWQCFYVLQPHEQRHLLPPGQHLRGGDLRPGSQLCGAMLGARSLALSLGRVHRWPQNLWSRIQRRKCRGRRKWRLHSHPFWHRPWLVHKCQAPVQSKNPQGLLLQSKMPEVEGEKRSLCMAQLSHWYVPKSDLLQFTLGTVNISPIQF